MLKSIVIIPNAKTGDVGALLAIARAEAKKKEGRKVSVRSLLFDPVTKVFVALYDA